MGLTLVIDEIIAEDRTYKYNKTLRVVDPNKAEVTEAYFAIKQIKYIEKESGETFSYTFKNKTSVKAQKDKTKIADIIRGKLKFDGDKKYTKNKQIIASFTKDVYEAKESITIKALKKEKRTYYLKVNAGSMGNQMYLVVETKNLKGKKVKLKIHENEKELKLLKDKDALLPVLVYAKKEDKTTDSEASDWIELNIETVKAKDAGVGFYISDDGKDKEVGIKKIQLRPKKDKMASKTEEASKSFEGWAEKLYIREDESADGKKSEKQKAEEARAKEIFVPIVKDDSAAKISYPKKISGSKSIEVGKVAKYSLDEYKYKKTTGREDDKKNILWSLHIKGDKASKYTVINTKSKANLYTYAKMEIVGGKNKLSIVFDKALKGKKIQIEPYRNKPDIDQSKKAGGYDYIKSTTIKAEAVAKITKLDTTKLWLETQCDDCTKKDKEFLNGSFFKLKTPDTIHIYSDGKMSKVNFKNLLFGKKLKYVYVDKDENHHNVCECELYETWEMGSGSSKSSLVPSATEKATATVTDYKAMAVTGVDAHKTWVLSNNNVFTEGKKVAGYTHLYYKASTEKVIMVVLPNQGLNYNNTDTTIKFSWHETLRKFSQPEIFAAFIGALAENGYSDVTSGGSSYKDGSSYPSVSHNNGFAIDTGYLKKTNKKFDKAREQKLISAMLKFGFIKQIKGTWPKYSSLTGTTSSNERHNDHLHSGGAPKKGVKKFKPNYK